MKRTPLARKTGLKAKVVSWWEKVRAPLPKTNKERRRRRREADEVYGSYHQWVSQQPCVLASYPRSGCFGKITGHHLKSVGAGGRDADNEVSICAKHHVQLHTVGLARFEAVYECDLDLHAGALWSRYCFEEPK